MKKLIGVIISLAVFAVAVALAFEFSYKISPDEFITDRTTFIYSNKNLNEEKIKKLEKIFGLENIEDKEIVKKIDSIYLLSQSRFYSENIKIVGIVDTGKYFPAMYLKLKDFFNQRDDYFYQLKDELKEKAGISQDENVYLKAYRGLFFVGTDIDTINRIIHGNSKKSLKVIDIINQRAENDLGTVILNQERERLLGIDRVVLSGNTEGKKVILDGSIYGDNSIIKNLSSQPAVRRMNKYIDENRLYFSTANLKILDTFILRAVSYTYGNRQLNIIQDLFLKGSIEIFSQLNGEIVVDVENGNYLFGIKNSDNAEKYVEYFKDDEEINIEKDREGNIYICIGEDTFVPVQNKKELTPNQFFSGKMDTYYGKIEAEGFYETDSLRIKAVIELNEEI